MTLIYLGIFFCKYCLPLERQYVIKSHILLLSEWTRLTSNKAKTEYLNMKNVPW